MPKITPAIKFHGGKSNLARRIVALMPPRVRNGNKPAANDSGYLHFVEPFFGGGQVLFSNDPQGISEVANDLNQHLINFWRVLANEKSFERFIRLAEATPFSAERYAQSAARLKLPIDGQSTKAALDFFVCCRQSLAGRMKSFTGITKTRTRRGMSNEVSAWLTALEGLPAVHARLKRVLILNEPAVGVIRKHDGPRTLYYIDAPYVHSTRASIKDYQHEMKNEEHEELISVLLTIQGRAIVSMYHHPIYDALHLQHGWRLVEFELPNNAAGGQTKRRMTECVWMNY